MGFKVTINEDSEANCVLNHRGKLIKTEVSLNILNALVAIRLLDAISG
jgi:hypothetical protein